MDKSKLVKFKGNDFGVGLDWQEFVGKKSVVRNKIKDTLKKKKHDGFGVKIEQDKSRLQVGFSSKKSKGSPSLAKFLAEKEEFRNSLVLINFDEDQFWMCSITKAGLIENGSDVVHDRDEFMSAVSAYVTLLDDDENFKIMITEDDADLMESLIGDDISTFNVELFDDSEVFSGNFKNSEIGLVYNASVDLIKQASTVALLGAVLTSGYFFVYLEDPLYATITDGELSEAFYDQEQSYKKFLKDQDKKLSNSYEITAKREILKSRSSAYTNQDLYSYIEQLSYQFPLFLVEWELEDIKYIDNGREYFRVSYKRIQNSYGNTQELKRELNLIAEKSGIENYSFRNPSVNGDRLFLNIEFKNKEEVNVVNNDNQREVDKKLIKLEKELSSLTKGIDALQDDVMEFSFMDKRFGSSLKEKEEEILDLVDGTTRVFKEMKKERQKLEIEEVEMNMDLIAGSRSDILSMVQSYSYYEWAKSSKTRKFPNIEKNNIKKGEEIKVFAQATYLEVGDGGNLDILGLEGLKNILLSKSLLNKKYIKVNDISFNLQTEEWKIKGEYYEKI